MVEFTFGVHDSSAALVPDDTYEPVVRHLINSAVHHCLCLLFIVDPDPLEDPDLKVDGLLQALAAAHWRGVDTRLLIGGSRSNNRILDSTLLARKRAQAYGIKCRLVAASDQQSNHSKFVVSDDRILVGSHNWSPGALTNQTQDSVLVQNNALAGYFASQFESQWLTSQEEGFDVPR